MKVGKYLLVAVAAAGMLVPVAGAADKNEGKFTLASPAQISSQQIGSGDYTVRWEGSGPSVQVSILRGKKVVATSTAKLVTSTTPAQYDQVIVKQHENGSRTVEEIDLARQKLSLVFAEAQAGNGQ